ncbi:MAG: peptidase domain-containing ABC transporter [Clostridium butyricum]|uniref:peptidase domain-containing ABC transporter n=1 Tax=Clostridium sp. TaxID=1506 RepID=UPI0029051D84|nr:peptidase domain-containing ABC transporter [Clostridium sp.]MDU1006757.1 peptidase domain-containing ABC transporter [Clostridium butyricum]MDU1117078.1 peptidase domain-containing ABC transporter [Clostridium sp.]MDU4853541.1 peptidase domain-containing ABC transporter [Clostridioides difficile]MDU7713402.1 peptidase domain-containing ABC transporter [Clostridium butyricum]
MIGKSIHLIRQLGTTDCGIACLVMIFRYYRYKINIIDLKTSTMTGRNGMSLMQMKEIVESHGFSFKAYTNYSIEENLLSNLPVIMCSKENHYVVISKKTKNYYILLDPIEGERKADYEEIKKLYHDVLILIRPTENSAKRIKSTNTFKISFSKKKFIFATFFTLITQSIILIPPIIIEHITNEVANKGIEYNILKYLFIACAVGISYFIFDLIKSYIILLFQNDIYKNTIFKMIDKLFNIDLSFFENHSSGDLQNRFNSVTDLYEFISGLVISTTIDVLTAILCGVIMLKQSVVLTFIITILTLLQIIFVSILNSNIRIKTQNYFADKTELEGKLVETLSNIQQIRCMRINSLIISGLKLDYTNIIRCIKDKIKISNIMESGIVSLSLITSMILYAFGGSMIIEGKMMLGTLIAFVMLSSYFVKPFMTLSLVVPQFNALRETMIRLKELINYPNVISNGEENIEHFESLEMKDVSFSYSNNNQLDIRNINLQINKGEKIAIVGSSGSGKTTITKLLLNVITRYSGGIYINSQDIKNINRENIDEMFAVVTQTPIATSGTIRSNLDIAHTMSDDEIYKYLELVELKESISEFPMGINTFVGENGQNISGGQRQRIAIARALIERPEILIFDEATSNLDPVTEKNIYKNLKELNITQVIITHRLNSIQDSDMIYVIEKGEIAESGTHEQLINIKGLYYKNIAD